MFQVERLATLVAVAGRTTLRFLRALMATFCDGIRRRKQLPRTKLGPIVQAIAQSLAGHMEYLKCPVRRPQQVMHSETLGFLHSWCP
jgi:hypothetical protein